MDFSFYIKLFVRRLPYFMILLVLGTVLGVSVAAILPPVYSSQATLVVENEQIPDELAASTVQTNTTEALQIIRQRILTRERLLDLADKFDIYSDPASGQRTMTPDDIVRDLRRRIEIVTSGGDRGQSQATLVAVGFSAPSGPLSANVTNEIVTQILDANVALRRSAAGQTLEFFTAEVDRLDRELAQREAELLAFQEENLNALPDSLEFRRSQQSAAQERLQQLQREASILRDRRNRLVTLYEETGQVLASQEAPRSENELRLAQAREDLAVARSVLADTNPRLRMLESRIGAMAQIVGEEQAARVGQATAGQASQLSTYEIQLADIDGQLESIAKQEDVLREQLQALQSTIEATPANAIRFASMQRDYEAVQQQYEQAVVNRARAETGDVIENLSKGQRITVIEPAVAPLEPSSPNRPLIAAAGMGAGFMMGLGVIVLLELLNSSVRRPADLQNKLGFVAFGTLPLMRSPGQVRRRRAVIALALLMVAVGVPAGLWYLHTGIMPLDLALERLLAKAGLDGLHLPI